MRAYIWEPVWPICIALVAGLILTGCAGGESGADHPAPGRGGEITIVRPSDIDAWDPDRALLSSSFVTLPQVMEGLLRPSATGDDVEPGLAQEWVFDDESNTITFTLRPDLTFSDGTSLTSADVAFSVQMWRDSVSYGSLYAAIEGVSTPDESTVVVELSRPSTFTLAWLANGTAVVVPEDFGGRTREEFFEDPIGAGPFVIDAYLPGQSLTLRRNDAYYDPERPYVDSLVYRIVPDPNQQLLQYQSGQAQMVESVPLDVSAQVPDAEQFLVTPSATVHAAFVNTDSGPGADIRFRRAVSYALDRDTYVASVFSGLAEPASGGLPTGVQGSAACDCVYEHDLDQARAELAESNYDGSPVVLLVDASSPVSTRGGEVAAEMLRAVGIEVDLQPEEAQVSFDRYLKGDYDLQLSEVASVSPSVGDVFGLVSAMVAGTDVDEVIGQSFAQLDVAATDDEREAATKLAENWIGEHLPYVPIAYPERVLAVSPDVTGLEVTAYLTYPADQLRVR